MRFNTLVLCAAAAGGTCISAEATSPGHSECAQQFSKLSKGYVTFVPEVPSHGSFEEYYFAWSNNSDSKPITVKGGTVSGSCIINRQTGRGSITLNGKELGKFRAKAPL
jgi:hypothetical protein